MESNYRVGDMRRYSSVVRRGCLYLDDKQEKVGISEIAQAVIEPGKAKALLVLDDGREIELGDQKASKDLEESGIVIVSDSSRIKV